MYDTLLPYVYLSAENRAQIAEAEWRALKLLLAALAILAVTVLALAAMSAGWLRMIAWCQAELSPIACSMYLAGF